MRVDPTIPEKKHAEVRDILERRLEPGENVLGVFAATRFRRSIAYLVITDRRLVTLGLEYQGYPVMDDLDHDAVEEVLLERRSAWRFGEVRARDGAGVSTYLGTLDTGKAAAALDLFEEVVAQARFGTAGMLSIPTPPPPGPAWSTPPQDSAQPVPVAAPHDGPAPAPPAGGYLPLVEQLAELGRLHQEGLLTEDEFTAAKKRVLHPSPVSGTGRR